MGHWLVVVGVILLTCAPVSYVAWVVTTTGADNPSNDLVATAFIVDQVLKGTYSWQELPRDSFQGGAHELLFPVLLRLVNAACFEWSIYFELYAVLIFAGAKLICLHRMIAAGTSLGRQLWLWPVLSALVFSLSQINVFTFSDAGLTIEMSQLGMVAGLWALVGWRGRWGGVVGASLGGLFASYSSGYGPLVWPVFLGAMALVGVRNWRQYGVAAMAAALGCFPYLWFMVIAPGPTLASVDGGGGWGVGIDVFCKAIGWPFANDFDADQATFSGAVGALLGLGTLGVCWLRRGALSWTRLAPGLMLFAYAVLNIMVMVRFRGSNFAPWYTTAFMTYWLALVGLAYGVGEAGAGPRRAWLGKTTYAAVLVGLAGLYGWTNLTYDDKVFYLFSRTPVSAACLRHYQTVPVEAEKYVFQWGPSPARPLVVLGKVLERHQLSVFGAHQRWTLQGDCAIDKVRWTEASDVLPAAWWDGTRRRGLPPHHYKHLNLFLHAPNEVAWTLDLPPHVERATFCSAVMFHANSAKAGMGDGAICEVYVEQAGQPRALVWAQPLKLGPQSWIPCEIGLADYAGQTITLHLRSNPAGTTSHDLVLWQHPHVDLVLSH